MQHGDIRVSLVLAGEPQKLLTYWRGHMRETVPDMAAVTIIKQRKHYDDFDFHFEAVTRTENKRAELSVSERSLAMHPDEIALARELNGLMHGWLSGRTSIPNVDRVMAKAQLNLSCEGGAEIIDVAESIGDPEFVRRIVIGGVFLQGEPRKADVRWLPHLTGIDDGPVLNELTMFEKSLTPEQPDAIRKLVKRSAGIFRNRVSARRAHIAKLISETPNVVVALREDPRSAPDKDYDSSYHYRRWLAAIERAKSKPKHENIRAWRAK